MIYNKSIIANMTYIYIPEDAFINYSEEEAGLLRQDLDTLLNSLYIRSVEEEGSYEEALLKIKNLNREPNKITLQYLKTMGVELDNLFDPTYFIAKQDKVKALFEEDFISAFFLMRAAIYVHNHNNIRLALANNAELSEASLGNDHDSILEIGARGLFPELVKYAMDHGVDLSKPMPNALLNNEEIGYFQFVLQIDHISSLEKDQILELFFDRGFHPHTTVEYFYAMAHSKLKTAAKLFTFFSADDEENFYAFLINAGTSLSFMKLTDLWISYIKKYAEYLHGNETIFSEGEKIILFADRPNLDFFKDANDQEKIELLTLALLDKKSECNKQEEAYDLVKSLIETGSIDFNRSYGSSLHPAFLITAFSEIENCLGSSLAIILKSMDNIDIEVDNNGETLADYLIQDEQNLEAALSKTKDPLFFFLKTGADLFSPSANPEYTYIAVSSAKENWSTSIWYFARKAAERFPDIKFHLVSPQNIEQGGEKFMQQFDGVMNPGGGDSYPRDLDNFNKRDYQPSTELEPHYQYMANRTDEMNIPYLGFCAGAQALALYHDSALHPLEGYAGTLHQINYIKGTSGYFMSLSGDQQQMLLANCSMPTVSFRSVTAHSYAADASSFTDLKLAAISENAIAMSYCHENGIRCATQFHPEHFWSSNVPHAQHQKYWLENFIKLAQMHRDYRVNGDNHPLQYFENIQERLDQCMMQPTSKVIGGMIVQSENENY